MTGGRATCGAGNAHSFRNTLFYFLRGGELMISSIQCIYSIPNLSVLGLLFTDWFVCMDESDGFVCDLFYFNRVLVERHFQSWALINEFRKYELLWTSHIYLYNSVDRQLFSTAVTKCRHIKQLTINVNNLLHTIMNARKFNCANMQEQKF